MMQHQLQAADANSPPDHSLRLSTACPMISDHFAHMEYY